MCYVCDVCPEVLETQTVEQRDARAGQSSRFSEREMAVPSWNNLKSNEASQLSGPCL
jgi:hypothetical protein